MRIRTIPLAVLFTLVAALAFVVPPSPASAPGSGNPFGSLDVAKGVPGGVTVAGWAIDPDTTAPIQVHVYVDRTGAALTANGDRPDVAAAFPGYGSAHGFNTTIPAAAGPHQVCAYGINVGTGNSNPLLGCRTVVVPNGNPFGSLDAVTAGPGSISVAGWAIDPDTTAPIQVHVYVDRTGAALTANGDRPDVATAFPGYGSAHGFNTTIPAAAGPHQVCAYGINVGTGNSNPLLGCRTVVVPNGNPFGSLDAVTAGPGSISVAGWAIDPDTTAPIQVHVYVDGKGTAVTADGARPDVAAAHPGYGPAHGYSLTTQAVGGLHQVCAYGINVGSGGNVLLGCQSVEVSHQPFGHIDKVEVNGSQLHVVGWAIYPDATDGAASFNRLVRDTNFGLGMRPGPLPANTYRPDVGAAFPYYGDHHGFDFVVNAPAGYPIYIGPAAAVGVLVFPYPPGGGYDPRLATEIWASIPRSP